ncbi:unnamed protein product [Sphagnum jensenii]|uniref:FF domain-containing protein n=1 Tax=Sphagnum jensenii TaxID=128206 RepID=A0ABP1BS93_9BRYO
MLLEGNFVFQEMLKEKAVAPFSKWEKELPKIIFDLRFKGIPSHTERRSIFEHYVRTRQRRNIRRSVLHKRLLLKPSDLYQRKLPRASVQFVFVASFKVLCSRGLAYAFRSHRFWRLCGYESLPDGRSSRLHEGLDDCGLGVLNSRSHRFWRLCGCGSLPDGRSSRPPEGQRLPSSTRSKENQRVGSRIKFTVRNSRFWRSPNDFASGPVSGKLLLSGELAGSPLALVGLSPFSSSVSVFLYFSIWSLLRGLLLAGLVCLNLLVASGIEAVDGAGGEVVTVKSLSYALQTMVPERPVPWIRWLPRDTDVKYVPGLFGQAQISNSITPDWSIALCSTPSHG